MLSSIYGAAITQFVYGMEICAPKFRMPLGISANFVFTAGIGLLAPIGYVGTNWGNMSIVIALLPLLILAIIPFTEESFRWYHSKGRIEEAKKSLIKFSKRCGAPISEKNIDEILKTQNDDEDIKELTGNICENHPHHSVTSMVVTDVDGQMCWWQIWDVGDKSRHQHKVIK